MPLKAEYTEWIKPPRLESNPDFSGPQFVEYFHASGLEDQLCAIAAKEAGDREGYVQIDRSFLRYEPLWVTYRLRMTDGTFWAARVFNRLSPTPQGVSINDYRHYEKQFMRIEIANMEWVRTETNIPVPKIFQYEDTFDHHKLGTPYILMEFIDGKPLSTILNERKQIHGWEIQHVHGQLVDFAFELFSQPFPAIGQIYDRHTEARSYSLEAITDRRRFTYGPFASSSSYFEERFRLMKYHEYALHRPEFDPEAARRAYSMGVYARAALFAGMTECLNGPFFLQRPGMSYDDILLDDENKIVAIFGWAHAQTVPLDNFKVLPLNLMKLFIPLDKEECSQQELLAFQHLCQRTHDLVRTKWPNMIANITAKPTAPSTRTTNRSMVRSKVLEQDVNTNALEINLSFIEDCYVRDQWYSTQVYEKSIYEALDILYESLRTLSPRAKLARFLDDCDDVEKRTRNSNMLEVNRLVLIVAQKEGWDIRRRNRFTGRR